MISTREVWPKATAIVEARRIAATGPMVYTLLRFVRAEADIDGWSRALAAVDTINNERLH